MLQRPRAARTPDQARLANVMIFLFTGMSGLFIAMIFMDEQRLIVEILNRLTRTAPLYFLIASVYFENRFAFYDLVVKRAVMILLSVLVLGVFLAATLPWLQELPGGAGPPVAVRGGAGAGGDGHAVAAVAGGALARSHVARPRVHAGRSRQARAGRHAAGHRRAVARRARPKRGSARSSARPLPS